MPGDAKKRALQENFWSLFCQRVRVLTSTSIINGPEHGQISFSYNERFEKYSFLSVRRRPTR